jgi:hypothetical protein
VAKIEPAEKSTVLHFVDGSTVSLQSAAQLIADHGNARQYTLRGLTSLSPGTLSL